MVPPHQTQAYGARSFSEAAPTLLNSLRVDIKIKMRNLCLFLKRTSKHFYLINFTPSFITLFLFTMYSFYLLYL